MTRREAVYGAWRIPMGPAARVLERGAGSDRWGVLLSVALLAAALALVGMLELSSLIAGMELPGEPAARLGSLASDHESVLEAVAGWRRYAEAAGPGVATVRFVGALRLLADSVFVVSSVAIAGLVLLRQNARRALERAAPSAAATGFVLDLAFVGTMALGAVSLLENGLAWALLRGYWDAWPAAPPGAGWGVAIQVLRGLTLAKWLLVAGVAFSVGVGVYRYVGSRGRSILTSLRLVRVQLVMVIGFVVVLLAPVQIPDVMLAMDAAQYWIFLVLAVTFAMVSWAFSRRLVLHAHWRRSNPPPDYEPIRYRGLFMIGVAIAVSASLVRLVTAMGGPVGPSLVPVGLTVLIVGLGAALGPVPQEPFRPPAVGTGGDLLPRLLGAGVVAVAGLAIVRVTIGPMVYALRWEELARIGLGVLAVAVAGALFWLLGRIDDREEGAEWAGWWRGFLLWVAILGAGPVILLWGLVLAYPFDVPPRFGPLGIVAAFAIAAMMVTGGLTILAEWFSERFGVPRALRVLRFRRIPALTLLVVWAVIAGRFNATAEHLSVRRTDRAPAATGLTLQQAFERWVSENTLRSIGRPPLPGQEREAVPLLLISSAGGGIRAATWTGLALDCLFEPEPVLEECAAMGPRERRDASRLFLGSGVSGGSLGLAEYATLVWERERGAGGGSGGGPGGPADWVEARLGDDYLSPTFAWGLFVEAPRIFLGYDAMDRAEVLERTWELSWGEDGPRSPFGQGFLSMQSDRGPLLILNGTSVRDGCTFNTGLLDVSLVDGRTVGRGQDRRLVAGGCQSLEPFAEVPTFLSPPSGGSASLPGATDLLDFLCAGRDVPVSTAALLSARFPVLSPTGRVDACEAEGRIGTAFVVDGGYVELSGAETLMQLWPHLSELIAAHNASEAQCVVPFYVQIDNGYLTAPAAPTASAPNEALAPLQAFRAAARSARTARAELAAAFAFSRELPFGVRLSGAPVPDRFAHLVPLAHPGVNAPLGWTLSDAAKRDLREQLVSSRNLAELREIRSWLEGGLTCSGP